jgi:hypothetical protein
MYQDCTGKSAKIQGPHPPNLGSREPRPLYLGISEETDFALFMEKPGRSGCRDGNFLQDMSSTQRVEIFNKELIAMKTKSPIVLTVILHFC